VFEPFFTTKEKDTGTGLGLAAVHGIVQSLHGAIELRCPEAGGTCVSVYLPEAPSAVARRVTTADREAPGGSEHILVVDDEPAVARVTQRMLSQEGYRVDVAFGASEAVAAFSAPGARPDAVVTDVCMPGQTGTELAKQIWELEPELPILLVSGYPDRRVELDPARRVAWLEKPYNPDNLSRSLRRLLDG
jgi:CheY-like chemotaxis protein